MPTARGTPRRFLADARQQRRALQPDLRRVDRAAQDELLGDHSDRLLPGRRRRRQDSDQPALRPGHGDAQPVPAAEQSAGRRPQLQLLGDAAGAGAAVVHARPSASTTRRRRTCARRGSSAAQSERVVTGFTHERQRRARAAGLHRQHQQVPAVVQHVGDGQLHDQQRRRSSRAPTASTRTASARRRSRRSRTGTTWSVRRTWPRRLPTAARRRLRPCSRMPASSIPASTSTARCSRSARRSSKTAASSCRRSSTGAATRIGSAPPSLNYPGWLNINRIQQFAGSITKVERIAHLQGGRLLRAQLQGAEHGRQPVPGHAQPRRRHEQPARDARSRSRTPRSASSRTTPRARSSSKATSTTTASSGTSRTTGRSARG